MIAALACAALLLASFSFSPPQARADSPAFLGIPSCDVRHGVGNLRLPDALPVRHDAAPPRAITARTAVVVDAETGRVLYDLHAHDRMSPASTTKIMTAILAIEHGDLDRVVVSDVDATTLIGSSVMGLRPGVEISVRDLLFGLMLPSGNDAAIQLAETVSGSVDAFVDAMNAKAEELGLHDTHFQNPHGLDQRDHYSSAFDLSQLARYAMTNPTFAGLVGTRDYHLAPPSEYDLHNGNSMLNLYPGADGVKIGWTERSGWTLVASATRDGHRLFATVLDSSDRDADASALLDYAFDSYRWLQLSDRTDQTLRMARRLGMAPTVMQALAVCP